MPYRWNAVEDLAHVRFTDDVAPVAGVRISQVRRVQLRPGAHQPMRPLRSVVTLILLSFVC